MFLGGIVLVLFGRTFIGLAVETFGFVNLFGYEQYQQQPFDLQLTLPLPCLSDFFPIVLAFIKKVPLVGRVLEWPYIGPVCNRKSPGSCTGSNSTSLRAVCG